MKNGNRWLKILCKLLSYILVAALASCITMFAVMRDDAGSLKLKQLQALIEEKFIGETDSQTLLDYAAAGMVSGTGDRWSYYVSADNYQSFQEGKDNAYVGVGITVTAREDKQGFDIVQVEPGGSAQEMGILPGDILIEGAGQSFIGIDIDHVGTVIKGKEGTKVSVTVLRDGEERTFELTRKTIAVQVAKGQLLENNIGYIRIKNFNSKCASETITQIESLRQLGATGLIFDVRYNPGGYKDELVELLDYLLPEGALFRSLDYTGREEVDSSDETCLDMPMAVLFNGESYSAAEFFAAALEEYDWAVTVGEPSTGKGYFQNTYRLLDGSAVALSVGKYFTPNGVSLAEVGGLVPNVTVDVDEQTASLIYSELLDPAEDPQVQAAVKSLLEDQ